MMSLLSIAALLLSTVSLISAQPSGQLLPPQRSPPTCSLPLSQLTPSPPVSPLSLAGVFSWCYYSASAPGISPAFTISASGTAYTGPLSSYNGRPGWQVQYFTGNRVQTLNGVTTISLIANVAPPAHRYGQR